MSYSPIIRSAQGASDGDGRFRYLPSFPQIVERSGRANPRRYNKGALADLRKAEASKVVDLSANVIAELPQPLMEALPVLRMIAGK